MSYLRHIARVIKLDLSLNGVDKMLIANSKLVSSRNCTTAIHHVADCKKLAILSIQQSLLYTMKGTFLLFIVYIENNQNLYIDHRNVPCLVFLVQ